MKSGTFQDGEVGVTLPPIIIEVKSGSISNGSYLSSIVVIFHFHDYGRKSTQNYCNTSIFLFDARKKPSYFPLYWLVNRDPYNGFIIIPM